MNFGASRKGNLILDSITIIIVIFVLAISSIFGARLLDELNTDIQEDPDMTLQEAKDIPNELNSKYAPLIDGLILFAFVLLVLFTIVGMFMFDTHPIFFIITFLLLISVFVVAIFLGNAYDDILQDAEIASYANSFTFSTWLFTHILELSLAVGFILLITLFIKMRS